jgi:hypothetical protein
MSSLNLGTKKPLDSKQGVHYVAPLTDPWASPAQMCRTESVRVWTDSNGMTAALMRAQHACNHHSEQFHVLDRKYWLKLLAKALANLLPRLHGAPACALVRSPYSWRSDCFRSPLYGTLNPKPWNKCFGKKKKNSSNGFSARSAASRVGPHSPENRSGYFSSAVE